MLTPATSAELAALLEECAGQGRKVELRGGGTRSEIGAPRAAEIVSLSAMAGVVDYDPAELVLVVRAGTPLAEVEALVAASGQRLAFDPVGGGTIAGAVVGGFCGPGRLSGGAARDHLLGFTAVSGRGEVFRAGGNVVKNVTGYDLSKLVAGSWGRLAALCELSLKVMPRPRTAQTLALRADEAASAFAAMTAAMGSRCEVDAAAFLSEAGVVLLRLEGFERSVAARSEALRAVLAAHGEADALGESEAAGLWRQVRSVGPLGDAPVLWRIAIPPSAGPGMIAALAPLSPRWLADWAGGQVWLAADDAVAVRAAAARAGGHAMLVRAPAALRATIPFMQPRPAPLMRLEERVRRAFDPAGMFETGRFLDALAETSGAD